MKAISNWLTAIPFEDKKLSLKEKGLRFWKKIWINRFFLRNYLGRVQWSQKKYQQAVLWFNEKFLFWIAENTLNKYSYDFKVVQIKYQASRFK